MNRSRITPGIRISALLAMTPPAAAPVQASLLAYEGFDYAAGVDISGQSGGTGWAGAWGYASNWPGQMSPTGLDNASLAVNGNALSTVGPAPTPLNPAVIYRDLPELGTSGTTRYFSVLLRPYAADGYQHGEYGGVNFGGIFIGKSGKPGSDRYGIEGAVNDISYSDVPVTANQTVLLVLRAEYREGADNFDLFVNPSLDALPAEASASKSDYDAGIGAAVLVNNFGNYLTDEIRVGETYADVVPTTPIPLPGAALLPGSGLAGLAAARSRSSAARG